MAITDQNALNEVQFHVLEPPNNGASWPSGLWTVAEVLNYLNQRQYDFLKRSRILLVRNSVATIPNENRQPLPTDWVTTQRVSWQDANTGLYTEVPRSDGFEADHAIQNWSYNMSAAPPTLYTDGEVPNLELQLMPAVNSVGLLWILYVALGTAFTGAGVAFTVPDLFVSPVKWGVVADMLSKAGRGHDPVRAKIAQQHYEEGLEAAKIILGGWA